MINTECTEYEAFSLRGLINKTVITITADVQQVFMHAKCDKKTKVVVNVNLDKK